jgi:hypothetical protein
VDLTRALHHLEDAQLIRLGDNKDRTGTSRHVLIQESAYDSLLRPERDGFGFSRWRIVAALGDLSSQNRQASQALEYHREAARLLEVMASAVPDDRLRRLFRQREDVAREFEAAV